VVQNLRDGGNALKESPFAEQFRKSAAGSALGDNPGVKHLLGLEEDLKKNFGIGWEDLRNDILGDAIVFAYRPVKEGDGQLLMLIRARDAKPLRNLVDRFNAEQRKNKGLKDVKNLNYKGLTYHARVEANDTNYYYLRGPVLVFSRDEEMLQKALDLDLAASADAVPSVTKWLTQLGADRAMFAVFFNPRAFDSELKSKVDKASGADALILKTLLQYWNALDGVVVSLTLEKDATLAVGVRGQSDKLPRAAQRFFGELSKPSDLWKQIPDDALFAVGGRVDFAALAEMIGQFLTPKDRNAMQQGANLLLLPKVGPDLGLWLTAPSDPQHHFPQGMFALRTGSAEVGKKLLERLDLLVGVAVFGQGQQFPDKPLRLKSDKDVNYVEGEMLPPGIRPAFGLKDGFLVLASAPEAVGRFAGPAASEGKGPAPLMRISFKAWRAYFQAHRDDLVKLIAAKENTKPEEAREHLDTVLAVLDFVDRLEVRHEAGQGYAIVSVVIQTAQPLRK